jgi:hypothetical protein
MRSLKYHLYVGYVNWRLILALVSIAALVVGGSADDTGPV